MDTLQSLLKTSHCLFFKNPDIGGASQHNSMPVRSPGKWGGQPENPV